MTKLFLLVSLLLSHEALSQITRQPDNLNRNLIDSLIESARQESPRYISQIIDPFTLSNPNPVNIPDFPINVPNPVISAPNSLVTFPNPAISPPNPLIVSSPAPSDPSVCRNLANAIQLMVLSDLLKSREGDEIALRLTAPVLSDLLSSPVRRDSIRSNLGSNLISTLSPTPNVIGSNFLVPSSVVASSPRIVISSNSPYVMSSVSNERIERGALSKMLKLLGGAL